MILLLSTLSVNSLKIVPPNKLLSYNKIRNLYYQFYDNYEETEKLKYNLEHVIPQSIFKKKSTSIRKDMHNIILYPEKLNLHRSNYKFTPSPIIFPNSRLLDNKGLDILYTKVLNNDIGIKTNNQRIFYPPDCYKGVIARCSMYFISAYPQFKDQILDNVIDPYTIINWHYQYPVSNLELIKNKEILKIQENSNIYITNPEVLVYNLEVLIKEDLSIFKNFDFGNKKID